MSELVPEIPSAAQLRQARTQRVFAAIEGEAGASDARQGLRARVIVPGAAAVTGLVRAAPHGTAFLRAGRQRRRSASCAISVAPRAGGLGAVLPPNEVRYLQLVQAVPATLAANAEALQNGYREYQELSLARSGLRTIYGLTLTLTLLLSVFAAIASSVLLASSMTAPLLQLAEGTKAVAEGNYRPVREFPGNDELNLLTQSFNAMTRQLTEARDQVEHKQRELENAKTYLERVLANLSAGVVVLNKDFRLVTANHGAARILGHTLLQRTGQPLAEVDPTLAIAFEAAFADHALAASPKDSWQQQIEVKRSAARGRRGRRRRTADAACARLAPAARRRPRLRRRVRRRHAGHLGPARGRLGRGRASPGARDQESADADPARRRAAADEAGRQAAPRRTRKC